MEYANWHLDQHECGTHGWLLMLSDARTLSRKSLFCKTKPGAAQIATLLRRAMRAWAGAKIAITLWRDNGVGNADLSSLLGELGIQENTFSPFSVQMRSAAERALGDLTHRRSPQ